MKNAIEGEGGVNEENIDLKNDGEGRPMKAYSDDSCQKRYEVEENESDNSNEFDYDVSHKNLSLKFENLEEYKKS